jgi:hypothetical protein
MAERTNEAMRLGFEQATEILDRALEAARPDLERQQIEVTDESSRSGFERSGWLYYLWEYRFERKALSHGEVFLEWVRLKYLEPTYTTPSSSVLVTTCGEIFQVGGSSRVRKQSERSLAIELLGNGGLAGLVVEELDRAHQMLAPFRYEE